jgi:hypothetical protein
VRKKWRKSSDVPGRGLHLFPCRPCPGRHHRQVRDGGRLSYHTVSTWSGSIVILSLFYMNPAVFCRSMKKVEMVVRFRLGASLQNAPAWLFVQLASCSWHWLLLRGQQQLGGQLGWVPRSGASPRARDGERSSRDLPRGGQPQRIPAATRRPWRGGPGRHRRCGRCVVRPRRRCIFHHLPDLHTRPSVGARTGQPEAPQSYLICVPDLPVVGYIVDQHIPPRAPLVPDSRLTALLRAVLTSASCLRSLIDDRAASPRCGLRRDGHEGHRNQAHSPQGGGAHRRR